MYASFNNSDLATAISIASFATLTNIGRFEVRSFDVNCTVFDAIYANRRRLKGKVYYYVSRNLTLVTYECQFAMRVNILQ